MMMIVLYSTIFEKPKRVGRLTSKHPLEIGPIRTPERSLKRRIGLWSWSLRWISFSPPRPFSIPFENFGFIMNLIRNKPQKLDGGFKTKCSTEDDNGAFDKWNQTFSIFQFIWLGEREKRESGFGLVTLVSDPPNPDAPVVTAGSWWWWRMDYFSKPPDLRGN